MPPSKLDDEKLCAHSYHCDVNDETGEIRVVFMRKQADDIVGYMIFKQPAEAYEMAANLLRCFDTVEGLT